ncbi:MAG TPA: hypothetical protein VGC08_01145 [Pedobacter sp.]
MNKKYLMGLLTLAIAATVSLSAQAQEKRKGVGHTIDRTATSIGHKTAEVAVKGTSKIGDKTYKGKIAPDGSDVYIDGKNRKYYVNKKGGKVYLKASQIRNKRTRK